MRLAEGAERDRKLATALTLLLTAGAAWLVWRMAGSAPSEATGSSPGLITHHRDSRIWVDYLYERFGGHLIRTTVLLAVLIYAVGLALSLAADFGGSYLRTWQIYPGIACVAWMLMANRWASQNMHQHLTETSRCFEDQPAYRDYLRGSMRWYHSHLGIVVLSAVFAAALFAAAYFELADGRLGIQRFGATQTVFPSDWYVGAIEQRLPLLAYLALATGVASGTSVWVLAVNALFWWGLPRLEPLAYPDALLTYSRATTRFYERAAGLQFVALFVALVVALSSLSRVLIGFILLGSVIATATLLLPHIAFHRLLERSDRRFSELGIELFRQARRTGAFRSPDEYGTAGDIVSPLTVAALALRAHPFRLWVHDMRGLTSLLAGQILALAGVVYRELAETGCMIGDWDCWISKLL